MLVILPFEEEFYSQHGVDAEFVGHPLVEELEDAPEKDAARISLGLPLSEGPVLALLPGSRKKEVTRHLPIMLEGAKLLRERYPSLEVVVPIASTIPHALIDPMIHAHRGKVRLVDGHAIDVLAASDAVVVASGTASLQAALLTKPIVVVYRVSWLTYQILRRMIKVAHIAMINLIAGRGLVPELIQNSFTARNVYASVVELIDNRSKRDALVKELVDIRERLGRGRGALRVAEVVSGYIGPERQLAASSDPNPTP